MQRSHAIVLLQYRLSEGSLAVVEYLVQLSRDLGYLPDDVAGSMLREIDEVARMLYVMRSKVEREGR